MRILSTILIGLTATNVATAFTISSSPLSRPSTATVGVKQPYFQQNVKPSSYSATQLFMGWGPDPIWSTATVDSNIQACPSGSCVSLKVNVNDGSDYLIPGQYVQVRPADDENAKPIFLAIASPPTGEVKDEADEAAGSSAVPTQWEFLIKKTDFNSYLTSASPGTSIAVSQVMGGGFPITDNIEGFKYDFPTQNLLLFACGSGIAPIRSAIESGQLNVSPAGSGGRTCTLYYGVRTPDDMPYVSKFSEWEAAGVQVVPVVSQPDLPCESGAVWQGRTGYVQNALEEDGVPIPRNSGALLCGVNGMVDAVTSMLGDAGVFEGRILKNF